MYVLRGGFLSETHAVARTRRAAGGALVHHVPVFNPASERSQRSWLRVVNRSARRITVTVTGRDDAGRPGPRGGVRFTLAPAAARMLSAQQLEAGASGLTGRLGDGTGRWQLFVASGGTIEVMSLMQNPNGHLSNVSATPRGAAATTEFRIVAEGATTVRPLETVVLTVPGGLGNSDYTVLMDLSGTGTFRQADTIEAEGLTTDRNRILFATPFTQMLADANRSHRLAVRVRRETDKALSPVLRFSVDDISVATEQVGFPSIMLETVLKSLYESADDPLLKLDAVSIQPGWLAHSARRLGLDTTYSDVQAEAILQSLFGMPVTEPASGPRTRASAAGFTSRPPAADALGFPFRKSSPRLRCRTVTDLTIGQTEVCDFVEKQQSCWSNWHDPDFGVDEFNASSRCSMEVVEPGELRKLTGQVAGQLAINWTVGKIGDADQGRRTESASTLVEDVERCGHGGGE